MTSYHRDHLAQCSSLNTRPRHLSLQQLSLTDNFIEVEETCKNLFASLSRAGLTLPYDCIPPIEGTINPAQIWTVLQGGKGCLLTFHWQTNKESIIVIMKMMSSGHQLPKLYDRVTASVPPVRVAQHQKKRFQNVEQLVASLETSLSFISDMALINCVRHFRRPVQDIPTTHLLTPPPLHTGNPHWSMPSPPLTSPLFR